MLSPNTILRSAPGIRFVAPGLALLRSRHWLAGAAATAAQIVYCRALLIKISWGELDDLHLNIAQGIIKDALLIATVWLVPWLVARLPGRWSRTVAARALFLALACWSIGLLFANVLFVRFFDRPLDLISIQNAGALVDFDAAVINISGLRDLVLALLLPLAAVLWFSRFPRQEPAPGILNARSLVGACLLPPILFNLVIVRASGDFTEQNEVASISRELIHQASSGSWKVGRLNLDPAAMFHLKEPATLKPEDVPRLARTALLPPGRAPAGAPDERATLKQHTRFDFAFSADPRLNGIEREIQRRVLAIGRRPNIVFITVESLRTHEVLDPVLGPAIFPFLRELRARSLYFSRFMAYGLPPNQSAQGHFAYFCGALPSFFTSTVPLSYPSLSIRCLPEILRDNGYATIFLQGHHKGFQGEFRFYRRHGAEYFYDAAAYPADAPRIGSGVLDSEIFKTAGSAYRKLEGQPFFSDIQTLTMHVPWGDEPVLPSLPPEAERVVQSDSQRQWLRRELYFDRALRQFLDDAARQPWFQNTIFFITGDHGIPSNLKGMLPIQRSLQMNWSPLLVYSPKLVPPGQVATLKTHLDFPVTVLQLLGIEADHNFVGNGLFPLAHGSEFMGYIAPTSLFYGDPLRGDYCVSDAGQGQCLRFSQMTPEQQERAAFATGSEMSKFIAKDSSWVQSVAFRFWLMDQMYRADRIYPSAGGTGVREPPAPPQPSRR